MNAAPKLAVRELGATDVATARGVHRDTARKWMKDLHEQYGSRVVYIRAGRYYTTDEALAPFATPKPDPRIVHTVADHGARIRELENRLDASTAELLEFRRQAHTWFKRVEMLERIARK